MGFEWSLTLKNKSITETLPLIKKHLRDEDIEYLDIDFRGISIPSSYEGYDDMLFIINNNHLYYLNNSGYINGQKIIEQIKQMLVNNGFVVTLKEL